MILIHGVNKALTKLCLLGILMGMWCISTNTWAQADVELANQYFANKEYDKAAVVYNKLAKDEQALPQIHNNYLATLYALKDNKAAEKHLKRMLKLQPDAPVYNIDYSLFLEAQNQHAEAAKWLNAYIDRIKKEPKLIYPATEYLADKRKYDYAERLLNEANKLYPGMFNQELARLYSMSGQFDRMVDFYLNWLHENQEQVEVLENALQDVPTDEEKSVVLEEGIYRYAQKYPDEIAYNELLIWFYLQQKAFAKAFTQAKSVDKRKKLEGTELFKIGTVCMNNQAYPDAIKIFEYIIEKYPDGAIYPIVRNMLINAKEEVVKATYPVDMAQIRSLANEYAQLIDDVGIRNGTANAVRSLARLYAFYLDDRDTAIGMLQSLITSSFVQRSIISQAKLDQGDIYLLKGEPWESTLLYSQVEKEERETNTGHQAKLKNAKLSYYRGDFELAKAHLDILKLATSREIANDAMALSILIQENTGLDTSELAMREFAAIDLLVFQSRYDEALQRYQKMLADFKGHSLSDEILWQEANIYYKQGRFDLATTTLSTIVEKYNFDILADDANFLLGKIYEEQYKNKEKAMEIYQRQLTDYPGSIFNVEARKRFRQLRGDKLN